MAAEVEVKLLITELLRRLDKVEDEWTSTMKKMDRDADSVDFDKLRKDLRKLDKKVAGTRKKFGGLKTAIAGFATVAGIAILVSKMEKVVQAAKVQEAAVNQVKAAIEATGGVAGLTAKELEVMAAGFQKVTLFGDEVTLTAQAQLLTFTKIGKEVFPDAIEASLNLATRMKTDLRSAIIQVGKALNDPIKGLDGLSRAGIQFTDQQKDQIKVLAESGKTMEAQTLVLAELEKQFGGSARAAAQGLGALDQWDNTVGDLYEQIGFGLSPALIGLVGDLQAVGESGDVFNAIGRRVGVFIELIRAVIKQLDLIPLGLKSIFTLGVRLVESALDQIRRIVDLLPDILPGVEATKEALNDAAAAASGFADELEQGIREERAEAARQLAESLASIERTAIGAGQSALRAGEGVQSIGDQAETGAPKVDDLSRSLEKMKTAADQAAAAAQRAIAPPTAPGAVAPTGSEAELKQLRDTALLTQEQRQRLQELEDAQTGVSDSVEERRKAEKAHNKELQRWLDDQTEARDLLQDMASRGLDVAESFGTQAGAIGRFADETTKARESMGKSVAVMDDIEESSKGVGIQIEFAGDKSTEAAKRFEEQGEAIAGLRDHQDDLTSALDDSVDAQKRAAGAQQQAAGAQEKTTASAKGATLELDRQLASWERLTAASKAYFDMNEQRWPVLHGLMRTADELMDKVSE